MAVTEFYFVLRCVDGFLLLVTGFLWVVPGFTGFYRFFTVFDQVSYCFTD